MWVVFWMLDDKTDHFIVCENEEEAREEFADLVKSTFNLVCGGVGPIADSTEHWHT